MDDTDAVKEVIAGVADLTVAVLVESLTVVLVSRHTGAATDEIAKDTNLTLVLVRDVDQTGKDVLDKTLSIP